MKFKVKFTTVDRLFGEEKSGEQIINTSNAVQAVYELGTQTSPRSLELVKVTATKLPDDQPE